MEEITESLYKSKPLSHKKNSIYFLNSERHMRKEMVRDIQAVKNVPIEVYKRYSFQARRVPYH